MTDQIYVCQIIELCGLKGEILQKAHKVIDEYANRGLRSLGVSRQVNKVHKNITCHEFTVKKQNDHLKQPLGNSLKTLVHGF